MGAHVSTMDTCRHRDSAIAALIMRCHAGQVSFGKFKLFVCACAKCFFYAIIVNIAGIAQLVERNLAKVEVESSRLFSRSSFQRGSIRFPFFPSKSGFYGRNFAAG
jgi:hypothetical protein